MLSKTAKLRDMLNKPGIIRAPGAYDAWSARLIETAGMPAVYMTGYGLSASLIGRPDIGLLTMTEMVDQARNMAAAVDIPVIADADNGYGGILNVIRTVKEYERAGVAAIQLEDQIFPKRCGHMEGKQLIPQSEMVAKIKAAVYARSDKDLIIIARTDARAVYGFQEAIERAQAYDEAGADVIFFEAPESVDEMKEISKQIQKPLLVNMVEHGKTPILSANELQNMGFKIVIYPVTALYTVTKSITKMLESLKRTDSPTAFSEHMASFPEFNEMIGLASERGLEKSFL